MPIAEFATGLDRVLDWARRQDYSGFSKFDAFNSTLLETVVPRHRRLRAVVAALWARQPIDLRPWVGTTRSRNPKGIGLFALAYLRRYQLTKHDGDLTEAKALLAWLEENPSQGFSGLCWGYDHDWYGLHFLVRKYQPNIVVTGNVAYAFLEAYEVTGEQCYLDVARSSVEFMLKDLEAPSDDGEMRSIGYVPGSQWGVLNINGLAATVLVWTARHTKEAHLRAEARRLIAFLVDKQTDYGAWHYAWPASSSNVKHDNYHPGNVLDWVLDYTRRSGDETFVGSYERGLDFYRNNLFLKGGEPKWMSHKTYPFDAHSAAQAIVTLAKAGLELDPCHFDLARKVARWATEELQAPEGYFYYQRGRFVTKRYTLMRWCNAWMAYGLATLLLTEHQLREKAA